MKLANRANRNQEDDFSFQDGIRLFNKTTVVNSVDAYIDEPIQEVSYYRDLLHYMLHMEEGDSLRLWINSTGGYIDSALAICDAMKNTEGSVSVIVTGSAHSAAGIIALKAPSLIIGDSASFMCHTASYGTGYSKQSDIEDLVYYNKKTVEKLCRETYKYFLSASEIDLMLLGKDYWFDADETKERLENRQRMLKIEEEAEEKAKQQKLLDELPKLTRTKSKSNNQA